ncbi:FISUMP domain-containing protein [Algibacter sp. 2305UL17-15]|uniref:FISUMP domain-containing protein n=1 Tax=Algibacter sp. 2305UL17-15 TaxID=3231268 RepID=UPI00345ADE85
MKKVLLILILIIFPLKNSAQDIVLTFDGVVESTGVDAPLDKVVVENLTRGGFIELTSSFIFNVTNTLEIQDFEIKKTRRGFQKVYPNPFNDAVNLEFYSEGVGATTISFYNLLGQEIERFSDELENGNHKLKFSPSTSGVYLISLSDYGNKYFTKVIATQNRTNKTMLSYIPSVTLSKHRASSSVTTKNNNGKRPPFYVDGDALKYTGYSGDLIDVIYDSPTVSKAVTFEFAADYYRFEPYFIESNFPSFVDVMFSVTDAKNKGVDYLDNDDFNVLEDDNPVSISETFRYIKKLNQVPYFQKTVIMLDNSSSVAVNLAQIKAAAISLVKKIVADQEIAIYSFSDNAVLLQDFTTNITDLETAINGITTGFPSTNLYGSLITGLDSFTNLYSLDRIEEGYLIALTDGDDTQGSSTLQQVINARGKKRVFIAGLGNELNPAPLMQMASTGNYFPVTTASELDANFNQIWLDILQYSNSFYWLNYMTPKRTGDHSLTVEALNNTNISADKNIIGTFPTDGFQSVFSGVYANVTPGMPYGVDWVNFGGDNLPRNLKAITYWASSAPNYTWSIDDPTKAGIEVSQFDNSKLTLTQLPFASAEFATVTLTDVANSYNKDVLVFNNVSGYPEVYTREITNITSNSAVVSGLFVPAYDNDPVPTSKRIYYSGGQHIEFNDSNAGIFSGEITGLIPNTEYFINARLIVNNQFVNAPNTNRFITLPGLATLGHIFDFDYTTGMKTRTSAVIRTVIANDGGTPIIEKGFVYSTSPNPTLATGSIVVNGDVLDNSWFDSNITGLSPDVDYYVRSYITNSYGTSYSFELTFQTAPERVPYIKLIAFNPTPTSASLEGEVVYDSGLPILESGVCWSTSPNPTITLLTTVNDGPLSGLGTFTSNTTSDLLPNTVYYARLYATNSLGTGYSSGSSHFTTPKDLPTISTHSISDIAATSLLKATATSGVTLTSEGGGNVTSKGICWSTSPNPTLNDFTYVNNNVNQGTGSFPRIINGLDLGTIYFVRAYATNEVGTAYGNEVSFTTPIILPYIVTSDFTPTSNESGTSGGLNILSGGGTISEKGVCWSTSPNPTIALATKTSDGSGTGDFTSAVFTVGLGTTFYYRAYAINEAGTAYGIEKSRTTAHFPPTVSTGVVNSITESSAISGGNISSDGGKAITAKGICWSLNPNPTIDLTTKTNDGTGTGSFVSTMTDLNLNLEPGLTYYVRAYAANSAGITYGNELSFSTIIPNCGTVTDYDGNDYSTITIGEQCWMQKNLDVSHYRNGDPIPQVTDATAWAFLTTGAWCYYQNYTPYGVVYGKLYNWYAVNDPRGLAPDGWHVASDVEWNNLISHLGGQPDAGGKMKATGLDFWQNPNDGATNSSGFTGLGAGERIPIGNYKSIKQYGRFWTSSPDDVNGEGIAVGLIYSGAWLYVPYSSDSNYGYSVRCIRD